MIQLIPDANSQGVKIDEPICDDHTRSGMVVDDDGDDDGESWEDKVLTPERSMTIVHGDDNDARKLIIRTMTALPLLMMEMIRRERG